MVAQDISNFALCPLEFLVRFRCANSLCALPAIRCWPGPKHYAVANCLSTSKPPTPLSHPLPIPYPSPIPIPIPMPIPFSFPFPIPIPIPAAWHLIVFNHFPVAQARPQNGSGRTLIDKITIIPI